MKKTENVIAPQKFWEVYSKNINEAALKDKKFYEKYSANSKWTKEIIEIAGDTIDQLLRKQESDKKKIEIDHEYFRIDVVGSITIQRPSTDDKTIFDKQYVWNLKVAYEHENDPGTWSGELCKLCYVAADLRVIHAYSKKGVEIESLLQEYVNKLRKENIINRIPNNNWLFVFGVMCEHSEAHRAFTLDSELNVIPVEGGEEIVPDRWK